MELTLRRIALRDTYTIGRLYVDDVYVSDTLEDCVRDLNRNGQFDNGEKKVYGETAIPFGRYEITMDVVSPKFSKYPFYKKWGGKLPRLKSVNNFDGVLIHAGNTAKDSNGCLLVGYNKVVGKVINSQKAFTMLMDNYLVPAHKRGESITLTIK